MVATATVRIAYWSRKTATLASTSSVKVRGRKEEGTMSRGKRRGGAWSAAPSEHGCAARGRPDVIPTRGRGSAGGEVVPGEAARPAAVEVARERAHGAGVHAHTLVHQGRRELRAVGQRDGRAHGAA